MQRLVVLLIFWTYLCAEAEPEAKPYYYYGGPGYYHGHYLRGLPGSPGYRLIHYARRKREAQSAQNVDFGYGYGYLSQKPEKITKKPILQYKLQLLQPYQHQASFGYPHYAGYGGYGSDPSYNYVFTGKHHSVLAAKGYQVKRRKRSAQSAHFVESDYGPPFKYADPPEIEPTQFRLKLTQPNDLPTEYQRRLTHFGFPHYENYNGYKDDPDYNYVFDPYENGFTNSAITNAENTSENQNKMTMMDIGQPRPIATDTWTVTKDNGSKKVVTTVTEPVYVDFMQLYGLY